MASPYVYLPLVCPLVLWRRGKAGLSVGIPAGESRVECRRVKGLMRMIKGKIPDDSREICCERGLKG